MTNCRNRTTNIGVYFRANADIRRQRWTANRKTFTAVDIRFVSPKGQDFIRQERVTKPGDPCSTIFSKWNTGHSPVSNFSIWNTEDRPVFDKLQYMEHRTQTRIQPTLVQKTQKTDLYSTNFNIQDTEHRPVFDQLQYMEHKCLHGSPDRVSL